MSMELDERGPDTSGARVLVVEDEPHIRDLIALHLTLEGLKPIAVGDGDEGLRLARAEPFDLVVLDLMLPGLDGVTVCRAIRRDTTNSDVPILMLTARREESDKVLGLRKRRRRLPDQAVRRARVRRARPCAAAAPTSLPARRRSGDDARPIAVKGLTVDPARRHARMDGREIELTSHEFDMLYLLASHPGIVFSREALHQAGLGRRHVRHRAKRRHAHQATAAED